MPPYHLPPGIMMASPLVAGAQFHSPVPSRSHDTTKRDHSRSSSTTTAGEQSRLKDDESNEREFSSQTKKDYKNAPTDSSMKYDIDKERGGRDRTRKSNENDEEKSRTMRDNPSLHGSQNLPSNLAFGRGNMAGIDQPHFNQAFPRVIYPPSGQGKASYRPPFEHQYSKYPYDTFVAQGGCTCLK